MHYSKHTNGLKSKSIKVVKQQFQTLGNSIIFWRNEAVVWTTETHDPNLWLRLVRWSTRWLGLISFSISSVMLRESDQDQAAGQRGGKTKTGEKVGPALLQMCSLRQGASRTISMLESREEPRSKLVFRSHYHTSEIQPYVWLTLVYTFFFNSFSLIFLIDIYIYEVRMVNILTKVLKLHKTVTQNKTRGGKNSLKFH